MKFYFFGLYFRPIESIKILFKITCFRDEVFVPFRRCYNQTVICCSASINRLTICVIVQLETFQKKLHCFDLSIFVFKRYAIYVDPTNIDFYRCSQMYAISRWHSIGPMECECFCSIMKEPRLRRTSQWYSSDCISLVRVLRCGIYSLESVYMPPNQCKFRADVLSLLSTNLVERNSPTQEDNHMDLLCCLCPIRRNAPNQHSSPNFSNSFVRSLRPYLHCSLYRAFT